MRGNCGWQCHCDKKVNWEPNKLGRQKAETVVLAGSKAVFEDNSTTVDITKFLQTAAETADKWLFFRLARGRPEHADSRDSGDLLPIYDNRPYGRGSREQREELAPSS